ncbi:MAG: hypothetical protein U9P11_02960 [Pseudomonadota bacterium]|nr:hypothetical protein [Pseudomonadota bacterium]
MPDKERVSEQSYKLYYIKKVSGTNLVCAMRVRCCLLIILLPLAPALAGAQTEVGTMPDPRIEEAIALMNAFAERTGLVSEQPPRRYLWTDAFAVCNYLGLARTTGEQGYTERALQLIDQVHHTLGRHRDDERRAGWISGLAGDDGERHPTRGGLRIGKALAERGPREPLDERLEWDRDGQYFHYLTKWMHALDQVTRTTRQPRYNTWARELARSAFAAFTYQLSPAWEPRRMVWKMSIDLTRAQVASMGQHDPLDGYVSNLQLQSTAAALPQPAAGPNLENDTRQYAMIMKRGEWATADPLGLGGLLVEAWRVQQLMQQGATPEAQLPDRLLDTALTGLRHYAQGGELRLPARHRLAFRELGLAIGLHAVERMQQAADHVAQRTTTSPRLRAQLQALMQYLSLREEIEAFWRDPEHQHAATWIEHQDINEVMLATSLAPDGFLLLLPPGH